MKKTLIRCDNCEQDITGVSRFEFNGVRILKEGVVHVSDYPLFDGSYEFCSLFCLTEWMKPYLESENKLKQRIAELA